MTEAELRREFSGGVRRKCYLFYGEEQYALRAMITKMAAAVLEKGDDLNRSDFDAFSPYSEVYDAATSMPFFAEKRLVIWSDPSCLKTSAAKEDRSSKTSSDGIPSLVADLPDTTVLIIRLQSDEVNEKKPSAAFKSAVKAIEGAGGAAVQFARRTQGEINKLLCDGASRRGCLLHPSVAVYMTERCGNDLATLVGELNKVCAYAHGSTVTKEVVDEVCSVNVDVSIYELSKRLLANDMKSVFGILDELFYMKTEAIRIVAVLSGTFTDIYRAKVLMASGEKPVSRAQELGYSKSTEFRLTSAARDASRIDFDTLGECLELLSECDRSLKSSRCDSRIAVETLLSELAQKLLRR